MIVPHPWPGDVEPLDAPRVYAASLDTEPDRDSLAPSERERADRFATPELTRRWTNARAALRHVLAAHAGVDVAGVRIGRAACLHCGEPHGKPYLAEPSGTGLRFNLSHSGTLALIAVAAGREVGIDVEERRPGRRAEGIASRWFTPAEAEHLHALGDAAGEAEFYRLWARKEAYLKATAAGLPGGLGSFGALRLEPVEGGPLRGWEFADVDAGPAYAAALVVAPPGYSPGG